MEGPQFERKNPPEKGDKKKGFSRRDFLQVLGASIVGATTGALGGTHGPKLYQKRSLVLERLRTSVPKPEAVENARKYLKETYGVDVTFGDSWEFTNSSADDLDAAEATQAIQILMEEMGKYPGDFFSRNKIQTLRIGKNLHVGSPFSAGIVGGYALGKEQHVSMGYDPTNPNFFRSKLHHEFMHVLDFWNGGEQSDMRWDQIHAGCTCNPEIRRPELKGMPFVINDHAFLNAYSETSPGEERAEFASMLMIPRLHALFLKRLEKESNSDRAVLTRKYEAIKKDYLTYSGGLMDQSYWNSIIELAAEEDMEDRPDSIIQNRGWYEDDASALDAFSYDELKK